MKSFDAQKKLKDEIQKVVSQFVHEESMKSYDENLKNFDNSLKYNFISSNDMVVDVSHNESYYSKCVMFLIVPISYFLFIVIYKCIFILQLLWIAYGIIVFIICNLHRMYNFKLF